MIDINRHSLSEKQNNIIKVLGSVIDKQEAQTIDIQKETGLSISTISRVISLLKQKKLLVITGKERIAKGRHPLVMKFNFDYGHIVHMDITPSGIYGCIANLSGKIIAKDQIHFDDSELTLAFLLASIKRIFDSFASRKEFSVLAAGLSLPGVVNDKKRTVERIPDIFAFDNTDIFALTEDMLKIPVIINNVPGIAAVGERILNYPECSDFVYLNIIQNIGIGAGIITGGKLLRGKDGIAGEVGDFYFDRKSFLGEPSKSIGRLEEYAGLRALYNKAEMLLNDGGAQNLKRTLQDGTGNKVNLRIIESSINDGDKDLEKIYLDVIKVWVILIIDIVLMINPEVIVIGGAVDEDNTMTQRVINEMLKEELFVEQTVQLSKKSSDAVFAGGLYMLKSYVFSNIIAIKATEEI